MSGTSICIQHKFTSIADCDFENMIDAQCFTNGKDTDIVVTDFGFSIAKWNTQILKIKLYKGRLING